MKIRFLGCIYKFCLNWNVERIDERGNEKQWLRGQVKKTEKTTPKCNEGWRHAHAQNTSWWLAQWKMRSEEVTGRLHKRAGSSWRSTLVVLASVPQSSLGAHDGYREARKRQGSGTSGLRPPSEKAAPGVVLLAYALGQYFIIKMGSSAKNSLKVTKLHP